MEISEIKDNIFVKSIVTHNIIYASGLLAPKIVNILNTLNYNNLLDKEFIKLSDLLLIFDKISFELGPSFVFNIGKTLPISINFLDKKTHTLQQAIDLINNEYYEHNYIINADNLQKEKILGKYSVVKYSDNSIILNSSTLYPCEFDKGLLYKICLQFHPGLSPNNIKHDLNCKENGNNNCTYHFIL